MEWYLNLYFLGAMVLLLLIGLLQLFIKKSCYVFCEASHDQRSGQPDKNPSWPISQLEILRFLDPKLASCHRMCNITWRHLPAATMSKQQVAFVKLSARAVRGASVEAFDFCHCVYLRLPWTVTSFNSWPSPRASGIWHRGSFGC